MSLIGGRVKGSRLDAAPLLCILLQYRGESVPKWGIREPQTNTDLCNELDLFPVRNCFRDPDPDRPASTEQVAEKEDERVEGRKESG